MKQSHGFSLIEVLVTIALTVVGVLGVLSLQSKSIQYTTDAVNRNTAIALADEFIEIMREHRDDLFEKIPPIYPMYSEIKNTSVFYNAAGKLAFKAEDCNDETQTENAKEQASCWLKKAEEKLPGATEDDVRNQFKVCPSFIAGRCADSSYKGSNVEMQVAWRVRKGECMEAASEDISPEKTDLVGTVCTYTTRVEL